MILNSNRLISYYQGCCIIWADEIKTNLALRLPFYLLQVIAIACSWYPDLFPDNKDGDQITAAIKDEVEEADKAE